MEDPPVFLLMCALSASADSAPTLRFNHFSWGPPFKRWNLNNERVKLITSTSVKCWMQPCLQECMRTVDLALKLASLRWHYIALWWAVLFSEYSVTVVNMFNLILNEKLFACR